MTGPLTDRQRAFVGAYKGPGSGAHAARVAGYAGTDDSLRQRASKLLKHPGVSAAIKARRTEAIEEAGATDSAMPLSWKLALLKSIAEDDQEKASDRIRAIELAAKLDGDMVAARSGGSEDDGERLPQTTVVFVDNGRGPPSIGGGVIDG